MYALGWSAVGAGIGYVAYETVKAAVVGGLIGMGAYVAVIVLIVALAAIR